MTEQTIREIVKSFAYGYATDQVAENEGISADEAVAFKKEHAAEIETKRAELKEGGWIE